MSETVEIDLDGRAARVPSGVSVAAALVLLDEWAFRTSITGEARAAVCGMGICFECRVTINGRADCRSCLVAVENGMTVETT